MTSDACPAQVIEAAARQVGAPDALHRRIAERQAARDTHVPPALLALGIALAVATGLVLRRACARTAGPRANPAGHRRR